MKEIKMAIFDVDGVLTDGKIYIDHDGHEIKSMRMTEIDALNDIGRMGIKLAAITGEDTAIVDVFERKVNWDYFIKGCKDKLSEVKKLVMVEGLIPGDVCYIGDGKYDIPAIEYVGMGVCPQNAIGDVKNIADIILEGYGGESCIYELFEILKQGR